MTVRDRLLLQWEDLVRTQLLCDDQHFARLFTH